MDYVNMFNIYKIHKYIKVDETHSYIDIAEV